MPTSYALLCEVEEVRDFFSFFFFELKQPQKFLVLVPSEVTLEHSHDTHLSHIKLCFFLPFWIRILVEVEFVPHH